MKNLMSAPLAILGSYVFVILLLFLICSCEKEAIEKPEVKNDTLVNIVDLTQFIGKDTLDFVKDPECDRKDKKDCPAVWDGINEKSGSTCANRKECLLRAHRKLLEDGPVLGVNEIAELNSDILVSDSVANSIYFKRYSIWSNTIK